ncbi:uncharacterized protein LOC124630981 [Helicoverpa zea]|uniref:uncharacterized protein LOC124630981 n=1 Tax=Helicoverpa zea TaxID=7113 RepID=UPI000B38BB04|nr:uncharacterized protein LOC124630981 [Helicoverpa zea]PZC79102.1 hypothetical protein B5X24_HaOG216791 [Helicoverpa armigera]
MDEEDVNNCSHFIVCEPIKTIPSEPISVCKCLLPAEASQEEIISEHKKLILSTNARVKDYLCDHRIPEFINYLMTKIMVDSPSCPATYTAQLIEKCMIFRAGHGVAPVIYEDRHLEAVIKSFDPNNRGWLTSGQMRRAFRTLGLPPMETSDEKIPSDVVLNNLRSTQEHELYQLLVAGVKKDDLSP